MAEKLVSWEHKAIWIKDPMDCSPLDDLGKNGWELVSVFCQKDEAAFAYFKRKASDKPVAVAEDRFW